MVEIVYKTFTFHKFGNRFEENEDAECHRREGLFSQKGCFKCALADGATQSSFSGLWSKLLVENFVAQPNEPVDGLEQVVLLAQKSWIDHISQLKIPWHAEEKVKMGAFATFLGVKVFSPLQEKNNFGYWRAEAIGDSCFFQVRRNQLVSFFPIKQANDFGNTPDLLSSVHARNHVIFRNGMQFSYSGKWLAGDEIYLMTDALAQWFLKEYEGGLKPWRVIKEKINAEKELPDISFCNWIETLRQIKAIRNDDTTLSVLRFTRPLEGVG
jgi:hypothetical protein